MPNNKTISNFKNTSIVSIISGIMYIVFTVKVSLDKDILGYNTFVNFYTSVVGAVLVAISTFIGLKIENTYLKYLSLGFVFNCILILINIHILIFANRSDISNNILVYNSVIIYSTIIFEALIIKLANIAYKLRLSLKKTIIMYLLIILLILTFFGVYLKVIVDIKSIKFTYLYRIFFILVIGLNMREIYILSKRYDFKVVIYIAIFNIFIGIFGVMYFNNLINTEYISLIIMYSFRYFAYTTIFVLIERSILHYNYNTQLEEVKMKQRLNEINNSKLKYRERLLKELEGKSKISVNKSRNILDNITDGILIFNGNILIYINPKGKKYFSKVMEKSIEQATLEEVIKYTVGMDIKDIELNRKWSKEIVFSEKNILEINYIPLEGNRVVILIKNNTYLHKYISMKKEYTTYIRDEEMKEEFYSIISHELRTPINVIHSALQLNEVMIKEKKYEIIERNNKIIKSNCNRLIRTINNFIDSNKITDGYLYGNKSTINIVYLIDDIVEASIKYVEKKNSKLIYDPQEEEVYIQGNYEHINRIILNLLSNALKYGEDNTDIYIVTSKINNKVAIDVKYKGDKIPEEKMMYIFEKFTKLDRYLTSRSEGSGLGLFLTKKLVEQNNGEIDILTEESETIFRILLPVKKRVDSNIRNEYNLGTIAEQVDIEFSDIYF